MLNEYKEKLQADAQPIIIDGIIQRSKKSSKLEITIPTEKVPPNIPQRKPLGQRPSKHNVIIAGGSVIGNWINHSTEVPGKLLQEMGYKEGQGLGRTLQGRAQPLSAVEKRSFDGADPNKPTTLRYSQFRYGGSLVDQELVCSSKEDMDRQRPIEVNNNSHGNSPLTPVVSGEEVIESSNSSKNFTGIEDDWSPEDPDGIWTMEEIREHKNRSDTSATER